MLRNIVFLLLAASCALAQAQGSKKSELAVRLAQVLDFDTQQSDSERKCAQTTNSGWDPEAIYLASPKTFGGIGPRSAYWARLQEAYRTYEQSVCGALNSDDFQPLVAEELEAQMTEAQLAASVNFFQSAAGASFRKAYKEANENARRRLGQRVNATSPGYLNFQKGLSQILMDYQRAPR